MSAFVVSNIATDLKMLSNDQRFIFGNNTLPEPLAAFKIDNIFTPVVGTPSVTNFETRNNTLSGFRWVHTTNSGDTFGSLKLQSFVNAQSTGTDILLFNQNGTITFNHPVSFPGFSISGDLDMGNHKIINLATPTNNNDAATKNFVVNYVDSAVDNSFGPTVNLPSQLLTFNWPIYSSPPFPKATYKFLNVIGNTSILNEVVYSASNGSDETQISLIPGNRCYIRFINPANSVDITPFLMILSGGDVTMELQATVDMNGKKVINAADGTDGSDYVTLNQLNNATNNLGPNLSLPFVQLNYNWNNTSGSAPFIFNHFLSNTSPFIKQHVYRISTTTGLNTRKWDIFYDLGDPTEPYGEIRFDFTHPLGSPITSTPFRIQTFPTGGTPISYIYIGGNLDLQTNRIVNVADPTNAQDAATKNFVINYVDNAIDNSFGPNVSLPFSQLTFNWAYASSTNPSPYQFTNTLTDSQESKNFKYRVVTGTREWNQEYTLIGNSDQNGIYKLNYSAFSSSFTPFTIVIYPFATSQNLMSIAVPIDMGGFEIRNALNPTSAQSLTTRNYVDNKTWTTSAITNFTASTNSLIAAATIATNKLNGFPNTTTTYLRGDGTWANLASAFTVPATVNVTGGTQTFSYSNTLSSSIFSLLNTNSLAVTGYRAGTSADYIETGYDGSNGYSYINLASTSNDRLAFRVNGTGIAAFLATGLFGFGTITPTLAKIQINGGVQNITGEESALRAISALTSVKIELSNTSASGKLYELRSNSDGSFGIFDRTAATNRFFINSSGNVGIGGSNSPNSALQFGNIIANRRVTLWETTNNDHQFYGFGINSSVLRYQVDSTATSHVFYAATSSTTSNELFRISGNGDTLTAGTIYGRRVSGSLSMQGNATTTTVSTANTFVKVAGTTTSSNLNQTSMPQSNRITYTGTTSIVALIICSFTATYNTGTTDEIIFAIYKNGAQIPESRISFDLNNVLGSIPTMPFSINIPTTLNTNDYVELWVTMTGATRIVTVSRYMMTVIAI